MRNKTDGEVGRIERDRGNGHLHPSIKYEWAYCGDDFEYVDVMTEAERATEITALKWELDRCRTLICELSRRPTIEQWNALIAERRRASPLDRAAADLVAELLRRPANDPADAAQAPTNNPQNIPRSDGTETSAPSDSPKHVIAPFPARALRAWR